MSWRIAPEVPGFAPCLDYTARIVFFGTPRYGGLHFTVLNVGHARIITHRSYLSGHCVVGDGIERCSDVPRARIDY